MAAQHDCFLAWNSVKLDIKAVLCHKYGLDSSGAINVAKRNKQLHNGDFLVIIPSLTPQTRSELPSASLGSVPKSREQSQTKKEGPESVTDVEKHTDELQDIPWEKVRGIQIKKVTRNTNGEINIHLDRQVMFRAALEKTVPLEFGGENGAGKKTAAVNPADAYDLWSDREDMLLSQMRTLLLSQHVSKLMQANGYNTILRPCVYSKKCSTQLQECGLLVNGEHHREKLLPDYQDSQEGLMQKIKCSHYLYRTNVTKVGPVTSSRQTASQTGCQLTPDLGAEPVTTNRSAHSDNKKLLDLRAFMEEKKCVMLPKDYDKNLHLTNVGLQTDVFVQLCALEQQATMDNSQSDQATELTIHVVSHQHSFRQQQVDVAWRILSPSAAPIYQVHLVHAGVATSAVTLFHELFRERREQMERAATVKYGNIASEPEWEKKITALTMIAIKFQFLKTSCKHQVKLGQLDNVNEIQHLPGVFVMYNYARLVSLLTHFNAAVRQGTYPDLPSIHDVDFGVLTDEDEWTLLFNYVLSFPSVVMETISNISPNHVKADIQSHKICQFLCDLSHDLSSYYSRVRVLAKPQTKLLPAMYARIYLLQAIAQVMRDGLSLLNIQPISEL